MLDRHYLRWPVLTYQEERDRDPDWSSSDRTIYTLRLPDGEPQPHEVGKGVGFQGAADEDVLIWTEMSSGYYNPWSVPIYGEGPDGQVVRLGRGAAGSESVCGGRAYWKIEFGNRPKCPACVAMYPRIQAFSVGRGDLQVVMVSRGTAEENRRLVAEQGFAFPVLVWEDEVARAYKVPGTPFFYVVDGDGVIVNKGFANTREQLDALVEGGAE